MHNVPEKFSQSRRAVINPFPGFSGHVAIEPLKLFYVLSVASFLLFIYGGVLRHNLIKNLAIAGGLPSSLYLAAKVPSREEREASAKQQLIELQARIGELEAEKLWYSDLNSGEVVRLQSEKRSLQEELQEAIARRDAQLEALGRQHASEVESLKRSHRESLEAAIAAKDLEIASLSQNHEQIVAAINAQVDELLQKIERVKADAAAKVAAAESQARENQEVRSQLLKWKEEVELAEKSLRLEEKRIKLDLKEERGSTKQALQDAQLELKALQAINQRLTLEASDLKAQNAQLFDELYGSKSEIKDELVVEIQSCLAQNEIPTEFLSKEVRGGVDFIYLKPTAYFEPSRLKVVADLLPGFIDIPKPEIDARNGRIEIKLDRRSAIDKIKDISINWLAQLYQDAAVDGKNFAILGARGGGKTELAKNICGLIVNNEADCEIVYVQPKIDDFAVFEVSGKQFEPQYIGFEAIVGSSGNRIPSAYEGIFYLKQLYNRRNSQNQQAFADGRPSPKFNRVFFLIDELQLLVSREKEFIDPDIIKEEGLRNGQTFCGKIVRDAISIGRSLGIVVLALGQIPNVSVYGWQKQDLYQFIVLFMAASIPEAIKSAAPTKQEEKRISEELDLWRKRSEIDSTKRFYCYVRPTDKSGYLALLPHPGKYLSPSNPASNVEPLPLLASSDSGESERRMPSKPPNSPFLAGDRVERSERLKKIEQIRATGEVRLKNIIALAFKDKYPKCDDQKSRDYKKAREEYRELTGE